MPFAKAFLFAELFSTAQALNFLLPNLLLNLDLYCRETVEMFLFLASPQSLLLLLLCLQNDHPSLLQVTVLLR